MEEQRNRRKSQTGSVVSNKMDKTVVVQVTKSIAHPKYGKVVKRSKKFYAHNDGPELKIGDEVTITETRPISKLKRWRVVP